jgi:DNA-binding ferritin-like protein (oxidative damage protectant)
MLLRSMWRPNNFHWHISGRQFRDDHLLFNEQADQDLNMTDDITERARKVGGAAHDSIADIPRNQRLRDNKQFKEMR